MGAAVSKNQAKEIASIVNDISQNTNTSQGNTFQWKNVVQFEKCKVNADNFEVNQSTTSFIKAMQLSEALQNAKVKNDIAQKLAQEAKSTTGFLGVGFASASNVASTEANATNTILNSMNTTLNNIVNVQNVFTCDNSTLNIKGPIKINQSGFSSIMTDQTVKNEQIVDLSNSLTQDISQKASATVQGAVGFLLVIALIIGIIAYSLSKPLNSKAGKSLVAGGLVIGVFFLFLWMKLVNAPPFFTKPEIVFPYAYNGQNGISDDKKIIEIKQQDIKLDKPPLKYLYNIAIEPDGTPFACLLSLIVSYEIGKAPASNNGYNIFTMQSINKDFKTYMQGQEWYQYKPVPDKSKGQIDFPDLMVSCWNDACKIPDNAKDGTDYVHEPGPRVWSQCTCDPGKDKPDDDDDPDPSNYLALPNYRDFQTYTSQGPQFAGFARFVFCEAFGFQNNYYIDDSDVVSYMDDDRTIKYGIAGELVKQGKTKHLLKLVGTAGQTNMALSGSVTVTSEFGTCSTWTYNFRKQFLKWGYIVLIVFIVLLVLFIALKSFMIFGKKNKIVETKK